MATHQRGGGNKSKDMARSVLASRRRRGAHDDLVAIRRRHRRATRLDTAGLRRTLSCVCGGELTVDECAWCDADVTVEYPLSDHLHAVWDRRDVTSIAALVRWSRERDARSAGGYAANILAMLPPGRIGKRAYERLVSAGVLADPHRRLRWADRPKGARLSLFVLVFQVADFGLRSGYHQELNQWALSVGMRPVFGLDDVELWAQQGARDGDYDTLVGGRAVSATRLVTTGHTTEVVTFMRQRCTLERWGLQRGWALRPAAATPDETLGVNPANASPRFRGPSRNSSRQRDRGRGRGRGRG